MVDKQDHNPKVKKEKENLITNRKQKENKSIKSSEF